MYEIALMLLLFVAIMAAGWTVDRVSLLIAEWVKAHFGPKM